MKHSTHTEFSSALDNLSPALVFTQGRKEKSTAQVAWQCHQPLCYSARVPSFALLSLSLFCSLALAPVWVRQINLRRELGKEMIFTRSVERAPAQDTQRDGNINRLEEITELNPYVAEKPCHQMHACVETKAMQCRYNWNFASFLLLLTKLSPCARSRAAIWSVVKYHPSNILLIGCATCFCRLRWHSLPWEEKKQ